MNNFLCDEPEELAELLATSGVSWAPNNRGDMTSDCARCPECSIQAAQVVVAYRIGFRTYRESCCLTDAGFAIADARRADASEVLVLVPTEQMGAAA